MILSDLLLKLFHPQTVSAFQEEVFAPFAGFLGEPVIRPGGCRSRCHRCEMVCPSRAITLSDEQMSVEIDLGRCIFCGECMNQCGPKNIRFSKSFTLSARKRDDLKITSSSPIPPIQPLEDSRRDDFSHALNIRFLSAGGCGGCRMETEDLLNPMLDIGRYGVSFVENPAHANALMVSGPVTENIREVVLKTWAQLPSPKIYIALGACQISGGHFADDSVYGTPYPIVPDLYIPGCPPHPATIYHGILSLLNRYTEHEDELS